MTVHKAGDSEGRKLDTLRVSYGLPTEGIEAMGVLSKGEETP